MLQLGILYGLLAAVAHAVAFAMSRRFILQGHGNSLRLIVMSHALMGVVAAMLIGLLWDPTLADWRGWMPDMLGASLSYLIGQASLFIALRHSASSRIIPLLSLKVASAAPASIWLLGTHLGLPQYGAVALSAFGALLLNHIGGRLPWLSLWTTLLSVVLFGFSDVFIVRLVPHLGSGFLAAARSVCVTYVFCGIVAGLLLPWFGSRKKSDWLATVPYSAIWLPSMFLLFACLAICNPVLGNIVLGTRGLFAIMLGALIASRGLHHLEQHASRGIVLQRLAAAVLMSVAIALYAWK